jgi:hypothetical protein
MGQLTIGDFIFNVHLSSSDLAVASFPPDEWLLAQQQADKKRFRVGSGGAY